VVVPVVPDVVVAVVSVVIVPDVSVDVASVPDVSVIVPEPMPDVSVVMPVSVDIVADVSVTPASTLVFSSLLQAKPKTVSAATIKITAAFFIVSPLLSTKRYVKVEFGVVHVWVPNSPPWHTAATMGQCSILWDLGEQVLRQEARPHR
jgi:hypothetical protein